jgi:hypothetical protein
MTIATIIKYEEVDGALWANPRHGVGREYSATPNAPPTRT